MSPTLSFTALESSLPEGKQPVVLIHGFASTPYHNWVATGWVSALQTAGYPLHLVTLPFHGISQTTTAQLRPHHVLDMRWSGDTDAVAQLTEGIASYLVKLGRPAHLIGFSLGARIAWQLALREPQLVHSLIAGALPRGGSLQLVQAALRGEAPVPAGFEAVLAGSPVPRENLLDFAGAFFTDLTLEAVPQCPTLLFAGSQDTVAPSGKDIYRLLPAETGSWLEVPRRDHISVLTSGVVRRAAVDFLGRA